MNIVRSAMTCIFLVWFGLFNLMAYQPLLVNLCQTLLIHIYIKPILFGLVGFYDISTIVGYLMPNPLYTYTLNIYDLAWLGFMAYQPL